jgi:hypothetical protein
MAVVKLDSEPLPTSETAPPPTGMPLPTTVAPAETAPAANGASAEATPDTSTIVDSRGNVAFGLPGAAPAAAELAAASFAEGVPLDFAFYALRKYAGEPLQQAVEKALAAITASGPSTESIAADEVVVGGSLYTHPSLYAGAAAIRDDERIPRPWLDRVNRNRATIERTLRSVGRIQLHYFDPRHPSQLRSLGYEVGLVIGTGVVVGPGVVMTNRHVADEFARVDAGVPAFRQDARSQIEPVVLIDFGGIYDDLPDLHRVDSVLYLAADGEPDVALLRLRPAPGRVAPPPIPLQTIEPEGRTFPRDAFVVGFPTTDPSDSRVPDLFRTLRVKRVSLGQIKGESDYDQQKRLYHNCTTLGGSSGSPLVDFETGMVWGLHFYGRVQSPGLEGNLAEPMWRIAAVPAIGELLGPAAMSETVSFSVPEALEPVPLAQKAARPVHFVQRNDIAPGQPFPDEWFAPASAEHGHVRASLPSVGLVRSRDRTGSVLSAATGFLIAPELVVTFRTPWQPMAKRHKRQGVFVDFAKTVDAEELSRRFRVSEIVYDDDLLALLRLEPDANVPFPEPLRLARERPPAATLDNAKVFLVGHPAAAAGFGDLTTAQHFPPPYLVKRLALGYIQGADAVEPGLLGADLQHDCSTAAGDAGGPVIALGTGLVIGVHIGGDYRRGNFAISMWSLLSRPEIAAYLS